LVRSVLDENAKVEPFQCDGSFEIGAPSCLTLDSERKLRDRLRSENARSQLAMDFYGVSSLVPFT
jgi:hypothetical protein